MAYLRSRPAWDRRYRHWLQLVAAPVAEAASTDPQLYFQEQLHDVQRTLERLATARSVAAPEALGFPKELPPSDTVARLLVQLALIREVASLVLERGVVGLASLRVEDPEPVHGSEEASVFLTRLPVRVRLTCTLAQLMKVLGAMHQVSPLIDVRSVRIAAAGTADELSVELGLARYLVSEPPLEEAQPANETDGKRAVGTPRSPSSGTRPERR